MSVTSLSSTCKSSESVDCKQSEFHTPPRQARTNLWPAQTLWRSLISMSL